MPTMSENGTQTTLTSVTLVVDGEAHPAAVDADGNWGITLSNLSLAPHTLVAKLAEVSSAPFSLTVTEPKPVIEDWRATDELFVFQKGHGPYTAPQTGLVIRITDGEDWIEFPGFSRQNPNERRYAHISLNLTVEFTFPELASSISVMTHISGKFYPESQITFYNKQQALHAEPIVEGVECLTYDLHTPCTHFTIASYGDGSAQPLVIYSVSWVATSGDDGGPA